LPDIERYIDMKIPVQAVEPAWLVSPPPRVAAHPLHHDEPESTEPASTATADAPAVAKRRRRRRKPQGHAAPPVANA